MHRDKKVGVASWGTSTKFAYLVGEVEVLEPTHTKLCIY